jgi:hypothetical protein
VYSLPAATSTVRGGIELNSDTTQTVAANSVTATASRTYGLQVNADAQGVVNVPWTDTVYSLPAATSTVRGGIELNSDTAQTVAANAVTATASRTYGLQINADGQGVINVPWTDTVYFLPAATSTLRGGIELGSDTAQTVAANSVTATASRSYALQVNADAQGVVNVPWVNTTYSLATSTVAGLIELNSDTTQTVAANAVSATASRTYGLQVNADGQGVVNVPWTDTNSGGTVTSVGGTGTVSGLTLTGTVTTSGNLTLGGTLSVTPSDFASQTANTFLAAPNGAAGTPTFRALVAADVPTLNQNTTGNAATASNASLLNSISAVNLYNNMGNAHSTITSFDATTPSYDFGYRFVQGSTNGPGTGGAQYYSWYIGLGSQYPATGAGSYGAMFAVDRDSTTPYLSVRYNEANSFTAWQKIRAGYADTAGSATTATSATTAGNVTGTVAVANGGTGATSTSGARTNLGATTLGGNLFTLANVAATSFPRFNADNTVASLDAASFRTAIGAGTGSGTVTSVGGTGTVSGLTLSGTVTGSGNLSLGGTLSLTSFNVITGLGYTPYNSTNPNGYTANTGTVTSVSGSGTVSGLSLSGTVTTSGALTLSGTLVVAASNFASQAANRVLAAPNGAAGTPTFRFLVAADIPTLNQNTTGSAGTAGIATNVTVTTSSASNAYKIPFTNTTFSSTGNYGLLQDSEGTFTYNPSTNTLTLGTLSGTTANVTSLTVNSINISSVNSLGFRNRIINGDMRIDQRNNGAAVTMSNAVVYTVDRWFSFENTDGTMTAQQSTVAPVGFTNSLLCTTTLNDSSLSATQRVLISQNIEGFNIADLGWGTPSAVQVTLSFWVRSSLTGTFGGALRNGTNTRSYPFSYTITSLNTFEQKTITIVGDTSGTWATNNNAGLGIVFGLGVGSAFSGTAGAWVSADINAPTGAASVIFTNGTTFYITGVQLEAGSVVTPFERRDYGRELIMCQRYYSEVSVTPTSGSIYSYAALPVTMRATPTVALKAGSFNGATYGAAPYGTASIRQNANSAGASDALASASAEL